jgi:AraC family transcriptional regulator of adaptative response/methylated-DNA-[protein]-cysteine methyltransferase
MLSNDSLWEAVEKRDARWDGVFVYAVPSTRIYCRPTCPSRRPRRDGVRFFAQTFDAAAAGFRPCRRCHPDDAPTAPVGIEHVRRACSLIAGAGEKVPLERLASRIGVSAHHLHRTFKRVLGISPREYDDACRVGCLKTGLRAGEGVANATYDAGFGSGSRVYERAAGSFGMTPAVYARGGKGEDVKYTIVDSPMGRLLVAATRRGVCAVKLGSSDPALERDLHREFPAAAIASGGAAFSTWVKGIVTSLAPGAPDPRLPLDVRATAFQRLVWRELQQIPRGATRSYQDVARRIGRPGAARAVARACATNPVAIVIPCHRVVREDGGLGGYHWGLDRKRALLDVERGK